MNTTHDAAPPMTAAPRLAIAALAVVGVLAGCTESTTVQQADAATMDSGGALDASFRADTASADSGGADATEDDAGSPDANTDAGVMPDAPVADVPEDAAYIRYERDVRPLLEASACADCHDGSEGPVLDYAWISAPGLSWCDPGTFGYERRWNCFEEHARTQTVGTVGAGQGCDSDFYHRHGEPCFEEETRLRVLGWAADGYRE